MKLSLLSALVSCLLFAAACRTSAPEAMLEPGAMAAASTDPCCTVLVAAKGTNSVLTNTLAKCIMFGATVASCNWPQPKPPTPDAGTGGNVATGGQGPIAGSAATGGRAGTGGSGAQSPQAKCIAEKSKDLNVANVAKQTGRSVASLVATICNDPIILGGFSK